MDDPMAAGRTARAALATPVEAPREPGCDVPSGEAAADLSALTGPTRLLDYDHALIQQLITERGWSGLAVADRVGAVYGFVRDEIAFGYNARDDLPASWVLAERVGQCNTKTTLLMALLRGVGVACRFHGFTIDRVMQKGAIPWWVFPLTPRRILHSWVEVWYDGGWVTLEGQILDVGYLSAVQHRYADHRGPFIGYAVATPDLACPPLAWCGQDTYIQREGITQDLGVYDAPDDFYRAHGVNLSGVRGWLFRHLIRQAVNRHLDRIRRRWRPPADSASGQTVTRRG